MARSDESQALGVHGWKWKYWKSNVSVNLVHNCVRTNCNTDDYIRITIEKYKDNGQEPWSSGYGRRLMLQRSWVWILAPYTGWTFFTYLFVVKFVMCVWKDENELKNRPRFVHFLNNCQRHWIQFVNFLVCQIPLIKVL